MSLGDGYIATPRSENVGTRLVIKHSRNQLSYLLYKKALLENVGLTCSIDEYSDKSGFSIVQLRTWNSQEAIVIRDMFYIDGKKTLTEQSLAEFDLLSLALLFQDDGTKEVAHYHRCKGQRYAVKPYINRFVIHTSCFSFAETDLLAGKIKGLGVDCRTIYRSKYPVVAISRVDAKKAFVETISPFFCDSMRYKIDLPVQSHGILR